MAAENNLNNKPKPIRIFGLNAPIVPMLLIIGAILGIFSYVMLFEQHQSYSLNSKGEQYWKSHKCIFEGEIPEYNTEEFNNRFEFYKTAQNLFLFPIKLYKTDECRCEEGFVIFRGTFKPNAAYCYIKS